jgi:hypothetical protein
MHADQKARESEKQQFFELAERLRSTTDESEVEKLKIEIARAVFGV